MSDSLLPHGLQHARFPCPSLSPRVSSHSCLLSQWCHPTISSSVIPFSISALNLSQHQGFFQWVNFSHQVAKWLDLQHQSFQWIFRVAISFQIDQFDLLAVQGILKTLFQHHNSKASVLQFSAFFVVQLSQLYMITGKNLSFTCMDLCQQSDVSALTVSITTNWKILKKVGVSDHLNLSPEKPVCGSRSNS